MGTSCCIQVDCFPLFFCLVCPLKIASGFVSSLLTRSTVRPGQAQKAFLLIAPTNHNFVEVIKRNAFGSWPGLTVDLVNK